MQSAPPERCCTLFCSNHYFEFIPEAFEASGRSNPFSNPSLLCHKTQRTPCVTSLRQTSMLVRGVVSSCFFFLLILPFHLPPQEVQPSDALPLVRSKRHAHRRPSSNRRRQETTVEPWKGLAPNKMSCDELVD